MQIELNTVCTAVDKSLVVVTHVRLDGFLECRDFFTGKTKTYYRLLLTPMPQIPSRFRETQFQQVAEHLAAALNAFPMAVRIDPRPLSVDTFARKLREGIVAKKNYGWKFPVVDELLWAKHADDLVVSIEPTGTILFGSSTSVKTKNAIGGKSLPQASASSGAIELTNCESAELEQLCLLLHNRRFRPTPVFLIRGLSEERRDSLESRYDIAIIPLEGETDLFQITS